jgi:hypothetical protein
MEDAQPQKTIVESYDLYDAETLLIGRFLNLIDREGHSVVWSRGWSVEPEACRRVLTTAAHILCFDGEHGTRLLLDLDGATVLLFLPRHETRIDVTIAARSTEAAAAALDSVRTLAPVDPPSSGHATVEFWALGGRGPESWQRKLSTVPWQSIRDSYAPAAAAAMDDLMALGDRAAGKLVLWHGEPGCGKTHALRALMARYSEEATFHYVTDPERFFGDRGDYLLHVVLEGQNDQRWKFLLLEDAGELLALDARERVGQGLSRLLNLSDGLVGQGLRLVILITTNEDVHKMHGAVIRPGRCLANVCFERLDREASLLWLKQRGIDEPDLVRGPMTLAELYAVAGGHEPSVDGHHIGF